MNPHSCNSKDKSFVPGYWVQDGWNDWGHISHPKWKFVTDAMSKDCRYDQKKTDTRCSGCKDQEEA